MTKLSRPRWHPLKWYFSRKLIHQIGLVILLGFSLSFLLTLSLLSYDKSERLSQLSVSGALQRVISVAYTLQQTPSTLHDSILRAASSADLSLSLTNHPRINEDQQTSSVEQAIVERLTNLGLGNAHIVLVNQTDRPVLDLDPNMNVMHREQMGSAMMGAGMMNNHHGYSARANRVAYRATINGSIPLASGQWLNFSSGLSDDVAHWSTSVLFALLAVMILTIFGSLLIIRRALRPVTELGHAAQAFAQNKQVYQVDSAQSPQDLTHTITAFNDMQKEVVDYIKERTQLLAAISHDLRTPLTSLRLRLEFFPDSDDKTQLLHTLTIMEKMLAATLQFAKSDSHQEARQPCQLDQLLADIISDYDEKGVELEHQPIPQVTLPLPVVSVRRVIDNLINNAIQYAGNEATIELSATVSKEQLTLCVADTGPGINDEQLDDVVKPFTRLNAERDTASSNVGLGLSICQAIAAAYGGKLTLSANKPHGLRAEVTFSIPTQSL